MTPTQCTACGGSFISVVAWNPAKWTPARWVPYSWVPRGFVVPNQWTAAVDTPKLLVLHEATIASAISDAYQSELYCRYDRSASALAGLSCNCGDVKTNTSSCQIADVSRPVRIIFLSLVSPHYSLIREILSLSLFSFRLLLSLKCAVELI
jgi:hypothetical protein